MRDESSQDCDAIRVHVDGSQAPYLLMAASQVPQVQVLFDSVGLKYTIAEPAGGSELTTMTFPCDTSAAEIQRLLDELD
jgi:hypothetical protein